MTLSDGITMVLRGTGLSENASDLQDQARDYLSFVAAEVMADIPWWFLDRTTTFNTVDGTRSYQPISGNISNWWSFVDETNNRPLNIVGPDEYDALDPDQTNSGTVEAVYPSGLDATTGYPVVELWRTPSAVATIRVRYRIDIPKFTDTQDDDEFYVLGFPRIFENILVHGARSLYLEDEGDETQSAREFERQERLLKLARRQSVRQAGNQRYPPRRRNEDGLVLHHGTGTVTAP